MIKYLNIDKPISLSNRKTVVKIGKFVVAIDIQNERYFAHFIRVLVLGKKM